MLCGVVLLLLLIICPVESIKWTHRKLSAPLKSCSPSLQGIVHRAGSTLHHKVPAVSEAWNLSNERLKLFDTFPLNSSVSDFLNFFSVDQETGLSSNDIMVRKKVFGSNALMSRQQMPLLRFVSDALQNKFTQLLLGVATISSLQAADFDWDAFPYVKASSLKINPESFTIFLIVFLNTIVSVYQSVAAEKSLLLLKSSVPQYCSVFRDGRWHVDLQTIELVPGDIIKLRAGQNVPADARIISLTGNLMTNEAALTGESISVDKSIGLDPTTGSSDIGLSQQTNMLFSGTIVTSGNCIAVVTSIGKNAKIGQIQDSLQAMKASSKQTNQSSWKNAASRTRLDDIVDSIVKYVGVICLSIWGMNWKNFGAEVHGGWLRGALHYMNIAVGLGVAAIPEGLPMIVTLCLSLGAIQLAKKNVIVRHLESLETLGCASVLCTDKTGTLTANKMTATHMLLFNGSKLEPLEHGFDSNSSVKRLCSPMPHLLDGEEEDVNVVDVLRPAVSGPVVDMMHVCSLCTEAVLQTNSTASAGPGKLQLQMLQNSLYDTSVGEPTEIALQILAVSIFNSLTSRSDDLPGATILSVNDVTSNFDTYLKQMWKKKHIFEFTRQRKSMSVLVSPTGSHEDGDTLFVKGAGDSLLSRCSTLKNNDGSVICISPEMRASINKKLKTLSKDSLRMMAFAYRTRDADVVELSNLVDSGQAAAIDIKRYERDLTLVGFCGIKDPPRSEIPQAMRQCLEAGIRVFMITGDSKETAVAIAKNVGLLGRGTGTSNKINISAPDAFTTAEFFDMSEEEQLSILTRSSLEKSNLVFARAEPLDKPKIIRLLKLAKKDGEPKDVVVMTGDGINDAPALLQADVGIAMGSGSELAKNAADIILANDNFATILSGVKTGRAIRANMKAFVLFLLSCNVGEVFIVMISNLFALPQVVSAVHLLWINCVTDSLPAVALGFNPPDSVVMEEPPKSVAETMMDARSQWKCLASAVYATGATLGAFVWWHFHNHMPITFHWNWFNMAAHAKPRLTDNVEAMTLACTVLISIQLLKALTSVSATKPLWKVPPWKNTYLPMSVILPFMLHVAAMTFPVLSQLLGFVPLSLENWKVSDVVYDMHPLDCFMCLSCCTDGGPDVAAYCPIGRRDEGAVM